MTKEEEKVEHDTTVDDESTRDDNKSEEDNSKGDIESNDNVDNKIDYKTELEKEREARKKAELALAEKAFRDREKARKEKESTDDINLSEDEDKPLTASQLPSILAKEREAIKKELLQSRIAEIATVFAGGDEAQKELIIEIHKNRSFPSHLSLEDQLEESYAIANRKKLIGERNEALKALKNKDNVNRSGTGAYQDKKEVSSDPKVLPQEAEAFKASGYSWNGTSKQWEKKLPNGNLLVRDSKTKQTRIIKV